MSLTVPPSMRHAFKIGVILPVFENGLEGRTPKWSDLADYARAAEDLGFDSIWIPDHLISHDEAGKASGMWEGWTVLTAIAAVTKSIEIGSFVTCASWRNPALIAKMADTVDEISGGRLILGLGAGWYEPEFSSFGFPYDHRFARFEEALVIITGLLRHGEVNVTGTYWSARECELRPRGPRPGGPPIMIGTAGKRMLALTAKHADMWNIWFEETDNDIERLKQVLAHVDTACNEAGRPPAMLQRTTAVNVEVSPGTSASMSIAPLRGSPESLANQLQAYASAGVTHLQVWPEPNSLSGLQGLSRVLEALARM